MAKVFAITIILIAIASAIPIVFHVWEPPPNVSVHGKLIDEQMTATMVEAGMCFLAAQFMLGFFIWKYSNQPKAGADPVVSGWRPRIDCRGRHRGRR